MTCFLHIGTMKTGTSCIQDFLFYNRDRLKSQGFLYPLSIKSLYHLNDHNEFAEQFNGYLNNKKSNFLDILQNFKQELINEKCNTSIISTENIQYLLYNEDRILKLKEILLELGFTTIYIIIYLRDPHDLYISMCSQEVKDGSYDDFLAEPSVYERCKIVCNHKETLINWGNVFGKENIIVRLFDKNEFFKNDLIKDFAKITGIQLDNTFKIPNIENQSLDLIGMELLHRINLSGVVLYTNRYVELIHNLFDKYFTQKVPELKYNPPKKLLQSYVQYFQDSNEWVKSRYYPNKDFLFKKQVSDTYKENYKLNHIKQEYLDVIAKAIADIITTKNNYIISQDRKIAEKHKKEMKEMEKILREMQIKMSLEYRFGQAIMNAQSKIYLPFTLLCIYISYKQEQFYKHDLKDSYKDLPPPPSYRIQ